MTYDNQYLDYGQYGEQYTNQYFQQHDVPRAFQQVDVVIPQSRYLQPTPAQTPHSVPTLQRQPRLLFDGAREHQSNQCLPTNTYQRANIENVPPPNVPQSQANLKPATKPQPQQDETPLDYQQLLLSLADEYLAAAHGPGMLVALEKRQASADQYYKLVATALGCIESVLQNWRLQPLKEAQIRLRYVQVLFEETDNDLDSETALSKGIELCERNKLLAVKYTMQALLARVLHRSNPKAALKVIDGMIEDVEAYRHTAYEYAFRFLRATTCLSTGSHQEVHSSISQLQKIGAIARQQGDYAVFAFAAAMESLVHLQSPSLDSVDSAQRALASARQLQLNPEIASSPQMQILMEFVDLCCSLQDTNLDQISHKLLSMQHTMDQIVDDLSWQDGGTLYLPLSKRSVNGISLSNSGLVSERNGKPVLTMRWLSKGDVYALGYLLSTVSVAHKNASDGHKAEKFLEEGLRLIRTNMSPTETVSGSLAASSERITWRRILECQYLLQKAFLLCDRSDWESARAALDEADRIGHGLGTTYPSDLNCIARYLDGTIYQGTGDLATALSIFQSATFAIPPNTTRTSRNDIRRDTSLLAVLNTILIIHPPSHPSHHLLQPLLAKITPFLQNNTSSSHLLQSAHSLIVSILTGLSSNEGSAAPFSDTSTPILRTKQHLGAALATARQIGNAQIISLSLALMTDKFFRGVVGDQAEKSARASSAMARKSGNMLWTSVCDGMLAESLAIQGKREEAERAREDALRVAERLPAGMQRRVEA
jgi:tetratricopeptide (TPR) repeat protein